MLSLVNTMVEVRYKVEFLVKWSGVINDVLFNCLAIWKESIMAYVNMIFANIFELHLRGVLVPTWLSFAHKLDCSTLSECSIHYTMPVEMIMIMKCENGIFRILYKIHLLLSLIIKANVQS